MVNKKATELKEQKLGDIDVKLFKKHGYELIDWIAEYLSNIEKYPVLSQVKPGDIKNNLPKSPPEKGESMEKIMEDFNKYIVPGLTHWNHPGYFAYFSCTSSYPGILAELLTAGINQQGMLWRTSPALTEVEEVTLAWLRELIGLKDDFFGIIYDTASISTLHAIATAREALNLKIKEEGMINKKELMPLKLYTSEQTHSSIEKAAITLGIGQKNVRKVAVDDAFQMDPKALINCIEEDIKSDCIPFCVVATAGTTSTTSIDPIPEIAEICKKYKLWLHLDAAYLGIAAIVPEMKHITVGWNEVDSFVVNPHKGLFTPMDLSAFYCKKPELLKKAFSLVPEYLKTDTGDEAKNLYDYGIQLGRRFRALKLWFIMRTFGKEGLINRIRETINLAKTFAKWVEESEKFYILAPVTTSLVCFRYLPKDLKEKIERNENVEAIEEYLNKLNEEIMNAVNATGKVFISHTKLHGRFTLRLAIANLRTTERHIKDAWETLNQLALKIDKELRSTFI
ncbi:MAG: amino acid decarboxylase [Candidatus Melainabacteria bacterium]|nr:amino acid decarboxylase [Candidatus Melainabacteria bacterium]